MEQSALMTWMESLEFCLKRIEKEKWKLRLNNESMKYNAEMAKIYINYINKEIEEILKT